MFGDVAAAVLSEATLEVIAPAAAMTLEAFGSFRRRASNIHMFTYSHLRRTK
jgi:hypothetical protein